MAQSVGVTVMVSRNGTSSRTSRCIISSSGM
jgi:hypothetical protein